MKADYKVQTALASKLEREKTWTRKISSIVKSDSIMNEEIRKNENLNCKQLKQKVKKSINEEMEEHWLNHLKSLVLQGNFLAANDLMIKDINFKSIIYHLPRNILKFLSNACIDTLPTNTNLKRWNKRSSPACQLCGNKETLLHVLNNCKVMLDQGRYTWRHNSVLNLLYESIISRNSNFEVNCDLPGILKGISTIPTDIATTNKRPDLVIIDRKSKNITLVELTVPFDTNVNQAHKRKLERYGNLMQDLMDSGYNASYIPVEIGSRGYISSENVERLKTVLNLNRRKDRNTKELNKTIKNIKKISIVSSYVIFYSKFEKSWIDPNFTSC